MTLDQLMMYIAVCEHGSFSSAAKAIYASRQAVSKAVSELEKELGYPLLVRLTSGVEPTDFGSAVLEQAKTMVAARDRIIAAAKERIVAKERLSVGFAYGVAGAIPAESLRSFRESNPFIELSCGDGSDKAVEEKTLSGIYDVCFAIEPINRAEFAVYPLFSETIYLQVFAGNELYDRDELSIEDLRVCVFVRPGPQQKYHDAFNKWCLDLGVEPKYVETNDIHEFSALEHIALREKALFTAPEHIALMDRIHAHTFPMPHEGLTWRVSIAVPRDRKVTPAMSAFIEYFLDLYKPRAPLPL